jgi:nucleotide-binding universal stress UspA family protein
MAVRPIVAGTDGTEPSLRAVEWAAMEAARRGAPLRIVAAPAIPFRVRPGKSGQVVAAKLRNAATWALGLGLERAADVAPGLSSDADLLSGPPAAALTHAARDASMLVVGTRGKGALAAAILGSVSRYSAIHALCPVVIVREETVAVHRCLVVGVGDPQEESSALAFSFEEAALRGSALLAAHARLPSVRRAPAGAEATSGAPESLSAAVARQLADTLAGWRDNYPGVKVSHVVVRSRPARMLAALSARSDLTVIGRHSDPDRAGQPIGSIHNALFSRARGPVAVIPSGCAPGPWARGGEPELRHGCSSRC